MWNRILQASTLTVAVAIAFAPTDLVAQSAPAGAVESATAQDAGGSAAAPATPTVPSTGATVQEITARIQAVQRQAMQDATLSAANREVGALISAALPRVEPNYPTYAARAQTLQADVAAARAAGDNARLNELAEEAKQLQANISAAQEKARTDPAVSEKLDAFKVDLFKKMVEIDPTVQDLVKQLEALQAQGTAGGS